MTDREAGYSLSRLAISGTTSSPRYTNSYSRPDLHCVKVVVRRRVCFRSVFVPCFLSNGSISNDRGSGCLGCPSRKHGIMDSVVYVHRVAGVPIGMSCIASRRTQPIRGVRHTSQALQKVILHAKKLRARCRSSFLYCCSSAPELRRNQHYPVSTKVKSWGTIERLPRATYNGPKRLLDGRRTWSGSIVGTPVCWGRKRSKYV